MSVASIDAARALAQAFGVEMRDTLESSELVQANEKNKTGLASGAYPFCHSHDFCDANMVMDAAWRRVFGSGPDGDDDEHGRLWGMAWDLAKAAEFTPSPVILAEFQRDADGQWRRDE